MAENNEFQTEDIDESTPIDPQAKEITQFIRGLIQESERSAVVLGAARLDVALEQYLKNSMQHLPGGSDNLFGVDKPLGSLGAKIAIAYRIGVIDKQVEHCLQMVRKIRNDFAHSIESASLSDSRHRNRLRELSKDAQRDSLWADIHPLFQKNAKTDLLADFVTAIACLTTLLEFHEESCINVKYTAAFD